jgi:anti-sigma B factor antagonist
MDEHKPLIVFDEGNPITVGTVVSTHVLDMSNVASFSEQVIDYCMGRPGIHLLLDFQNVTYLASSALTELLRIDAALKSVHGSMRLCSLTPEILNVFEITNLHTLFVIHQDDTVEKARARFERSLAVAAEEDAWSSE